MQVFNINRTPIKQAIEIKVSLIVLPLDREGPAREALPVGIMVEW